MDTVSSLETPTQPSRAARKPPSVILVLMIGVLVVLALTMIVPFANVLAVSFTTDLESYEHTIKLFPRNPSVEGYHALFSQLDVLRPFLNNVVVTVVGTLLHVVICSLAGFVLARDRFPGKRVAVVLVTLPMMIPFEMIIIPVYATVRALGLIDTLVSLMLIGAAATFSILLMRNYFAAIPRSLEESARIDGASDLQVFARVYVPLAAPGLATVTVFQFVARWNHFLEAVLFINSPRKYTLQVALQSLIINQEVATSTTSSVANNSRMAGIVISVLPLIVLYVLFQRFFIRGIYLGALKE